ncbi:hypothetical protein KRR55_06215 [Paeniglutamicibacter sp. ABSL32-1]|uniref:hypothetical protein n=1 Tax=Paeniglutamicibacter quisquiliarum TaxID=2849498 RepID=UPI001C2D0383|nr:hypothetical protein [Paeniglutamicibacter quisquiliarum]MBV1778706.1 hypothetical protein [Paeniglutamicibacter quisquiliarum]
MSDALGKLGEESRKPTSSVWEVSPMIRDQVKVSKTVMDMVRTAGAFESLKSTYESPLRNSAWQTAISRNNVSWMKNVATPVSPFKGMRDIMGVSALRSFNASATKPAITALSKMMDTSSIIESSFKNMAGPRNAFAEMAAANVGATSIVKTLSYKPALGLVKYPGFKDMMSSVQWSTVLADPLQDYLESDPFPELQHLADELGIDMLDEEQEEFAAEFLEAQPDVATAIKKAPGYWDASPAYRKLFVSIIAVAMGAWVAFGVLMIEKDHPIFGPLLSDLGIDPFIAGTLTSGGIYTLGAKLESARSKGQTKDVEELPDN